MSTATRAPRRSSISARERRSRRGTPTWEIARFFPDQGEWSESDYLGLPEYRRIEFVDGCLDFLPMPTKTHQRLLQFLFRLLEDLVVAQDLGQVFTSGYRVRVRRGKYCEPDVYFVRKGRKLEEQFAHGADLVIEIVSEGQEHRDRDLIEKRKDYAAGRVPEYWIVDPENETITVLTLRRNAYRLHGEFRPGQTATSALLPAFKVDVAACFKAAQKS
jgi:Uma2 family endonuclease